MRDMAKVDVPFVQAIIDRHGKPRYYYRRRGFARVTLPGEPGSVEFAEAYRLANLNGRRKATSPTEGPRSIGALIAEYYQSSAFPAAPNSQKSYRSVLEQFRRQYGSEEARDFNKTNLNVIFHEMASTPAQASLLRKRLRAVFDLGEALGWVKENPIVATKTIKYKVKGFTPWSEADITAYRERWKPGTKQRLAMEILLGTGVRRSDACLLGRQHMTARGLSVVQEKTDERVTIQIHPDLAAELAKVPAAQLTFVLTEWGGPFTANGFTKWMRGNAIAAGLKNRSPHGLRKAAGRRLAEAGCSEEQIAAVLGHSDPGTAKIYTKDASQERMANDAMNKLIGPKKRTKT